MKITSKRHPETDLALTAFNRASEIFMATRINRALEVSCLFISSAPKVKWISDEITVVPAHEIKLKGKK